MTASLSRKIFLVSSILLALPQLGFSAPANSLIKGTRDTVYFMSGDGKRYVFPTSKTFASWYSDFSSVVSITDTELSSIPLGGNVTYRPGFRMVKIDTDPKVYAVAKGGVLRWVTSEAMARVLYGADWNLKIDDIPDGFFPNYIVGDPILSVGDFSPADAMSSSQSIGAIDVFSRTVTSSIPVTSTTTTAEVPKPVITSFHARIATEEERCDHYGSDCHSYKRVDLSWTSSDALTCKISSAMDPETSVYPVFSGVGYFPVGQTSITFQDTRESITPVRTWPRVAHYLVCESTNELKSELAKITIDSSLPVGTEIISQ